MHKCLLAAVATLAALVVAPSALAAPDHSVTVGDATPTASWDGAPATGVQGLMPCPPPDGVCDTPSEATLIHVTDPGTISVVTSGGPTTQDVDIELYTSDASGSVGDSIDSSAGATADEQVGTGVAEPGYYLAVVTPFTAVQGSYHAAVTFTPDEVMFTATAPRHKGLTEEDPTFSWGGGPGNGLVLDCGATPANACDYTLIHIDKPGDIAVSVTTTQKSAFAYLQVYASDANGDPTGDAIIDESTIGPLEDDPTAGTPMAGGASGLEPGYYVIQMGWLVAVQDTYNGTVTFTPTPADDGSDDD